MNRFDRFTVDGALRVLAVEDGCQAADQPPTDKCLLSADRTLAALNAGCDAPRYPVAYSSARSRSPT